MSDEEKKTAELNGVQEEKRDKHDHGPEKKRKRRSVKEVFNDYRGEYKKIIWPSRDELIKETIQVVLVCLIFGAVITVLDLAFFNGYSWLKDLTQAPAPAPVSTDTPISMVRALFRLG